MPTARIGQFRTQVDERLQYNMANSTAPTKSTLSYEKKSLNHKWQIFKDSILQVAKMSLKTKKQGRYDDDKVPNKLITFRQHLTTLNKIFAFFTTVILPGSHSQRTTTSFSRLQHVWSERSKKPFLSALYKDIIIDLPFHIDSTNIPIVISNNTLPRFKTFRAEVTALRNLVRIQRTTLESSHRASLIKEYEEDRCANYTVNKAAFIAFSLNKSKRSIVLDRAMNINNNNATVLETALHKVKELANNYFRTIAGSPLTNTSSIEEMTDRWQLAYLPNDDIDSSIYNNLLDSPTDEK